MRIATFNANSVRLRLGVVLDWMVRHEADVLAIQETKCDDSLFPRDAFEEAGLHVAYHGMKGYNGVALAAREPIRVVCQGFGDDLWPQDCRLMIAEVAGVVVVNTYVPNGTAVGSEKFDYKLRWLERFGELCRRELRTDTPAVWLGDINIAPTPDDVFEPDKHRGRVGHHPAEFAALAGVVEWGWSDCFRQHTSGPGHYTYWEFVIPKAFERNLGWRIDHIYASPALAGRCTGCWIDREPRGGERPSDHTFVAADFA